MRIVQERVVREIRPLRAMWRVLETGSRKLLNGHENGNVGYGQGVSHGSPRQRPTLPACCCIWSSQTLPVLLLLSQPQISVKSSVLDSFGQMLRFQVFGAFKISDRSSHFQDAVVAAGGKAKFGDGVFQDLFALGSQDAVFANVARAHLRVGVNVFIEEAAELRVAGGYHAMPDGFRRLRDTAAGQVFIWNRGHVHLNIDAIHQRSRNFRHVSLDLWGCAEAFAAEVIREATRLRMRNFATPLKSRLNLIVRLRRYALNG